MTKNPNDHREWTNEEVEQDSAGYLAAQERYHDLKHQAEEANRLADQREAFVAEFVRNGGRESDARNAFEEHRRKTAAAAAEQADKSAEHRTRRRALERF